MIQNKLKLTEIVRNKLYIVKAMLKPILSFRYLVEEKIRSLQGNIYIC